VRIIAATNRDLERAVQERSFRADLYYRLAVFPVRVPPLRERPDDIPPLVRHFVRKHAARMDRTIETISTASLEALTAYNWPGNIRELQNVIERSVVLSHGPELLVALPEGAGSRKPFALPARLTSGTEANERARILEALKECRGQVGGESGAAARLGLKRTTLQARMRKFHIARLFE
jgi:formate hydrogenlyase transcriptional activator